MKRLFHIADRADATALLDAERDARWSPTSLASEGFVHLSFAEQVAGTLALHFAQAQGLTLLELDAERLAPALRIERSCGDERFPHLYRPLERADVLRHWPLERDACGSFTSPHLDT